MVFSLVVSRLVGNEAHALDLLDVIESNDANEGSGVGPLGLFQLPQNLGSILASEKGKLPHGPVPAIIVSRASIVLTVDNASQIELQAWHPAIAEEVINLLCDGVGGKGGKVGEGLELDVVNWAPHLSEKGRSDPILCHLDSTQQAPSV